MTDIQDTYFLNYDVALNVAKQQNMINKHSQQICYYNGESKEDKLPNLINLPFEDLANYFLLENNRVPTTINFDGLDLSQNIVEDIKNSFNNLISSITKNMNLLTDQLINNIKTQVIDFNEPLRFLFIGSRNTTVMQYVSKNMAESLKTLGYDVKLEINNEFEDMNVSRLVKTLFEYKPHVFITINSIYSQYLNYNTFQFIWYQDPMPELTNNNCQIRLRKRDFVFSLVKEIDSFLNNKNVPFMRQGFCTNLVNSDISIEREKKIVFIGSSYADMIHQNEATAKITDILINWISTGKPFYQSFIDKIVEEFKYNKEYLTIQLIPAILRDISVLWLCSIKSNYTIEIYGEGWDKYEEVLPYYKGVLNYGEDISNVYSTATYAFAPHNLYTLQQRVFEATTAGAIPIVYDCREISDEENYDEALCYFNTFQSLEDILKNNEVPKKNFSRLLEENSYNSFSKKILKIIDSELKK